MRVENTSAHYLTSQGSVKIFEGPGNRRGMDRPESREDDERE